MPLSRRTLLTTLPMSLLAAPRTVPLGCQTNAWPIKPADPNTFFSALQDIRELGFTGFETGFRNLEPHAADFTSFRQRIADSGLTFFAVHIFLTQYDPTSYVAPLDLATRVARWGSQLGAQRLILSGAPAPDPAPKARALNELGRVAKDLGLRLCYHNHGPEVRDNASELSAILNATDPKLFSLVLDAGHAYRAGLDLPAFLSKHASRIDGIHFRDFQGDQQVPFGQGTFPIQAVAATLKKARWKGWALAEEERTDGTKPARSAALPAFQTLSRSFT